MASAGDLGFGSSSPHPDKGCPHPSRTLRRAGASTLVEWNKTGPLGSIASRPCQSTNDHVRARQMISHKSVVQRMMYEIYTGHAVCDMGNRRAAVFWQVKLLTAFGVAFTLLYLALDRLDSSFAPFLFVLIVVGVFIRRATEAGRWAVFLMKDSAYGRVAELGIEYRTLFGARAIRWSQIDHVDYYPNTGRITIFIRDHWLPIHFGPNKHAVLGTQEPTLTNLLRKQVETFGGTFVRKR